MNKKQLIISGTLAFIISLFFCIPGYSSWTEYKKVSYMDLDGDSNEEIIIEANHGAGSNHYIEDMRIFKDKYPELELIFNIRKIDSTFGFTEEMAEYNCDIISSVEFTEETAENKGVRDIIVKSKKIYYKDDENKIVDREEDLGTKTYKWAGKEYTADE